MRTVVALIAMLACGVSAGAAASSPLVGLNWVSAGVEVRHYDPATLKPLGRPLTLQMPAWRWAYSPGGTRLALVGGTTSPTTALAVVDRRGLRRLGRASIAGIYPQGLLWTRADRLLLVGGSGGRTEVLAIDPGSLRVLDRLRLDGRVVRGETFDGGVVLLLAPAGRIGATSLVTVNAQLEARTVAIGRIRGGQRAVEDPADPGVPSTEQRTPGLAVDPLRGIAYVVGDGEPVAIVDLARASVTYRDLPERQTASVRKSLQGSFVVASWLADGRLAITGTRYDGLDPATRLFRRETLGLSILDVRSWDLRLVDAEAEGVTKYDRWLVTTGSKGLRWYDFAGRLRGELFAKYGAGIDVSAFGDRLAVRLVDAQRTVRVDLRTGRVVGRLDYDSFPPRFLATETSDIFD